MIKLIKNKIIVLLIVFSLFPNIMWAEAAAPQEAMSKASELVRSAESVIAEAEKSKAKADEAVALSMETIEKAQVVLEKAETTLAENDETIALLKDNINHLQSLQAIDKTYIEKQDFWIVASFASTLVFSVFFFFQNTLLKNSNMKLYFLLKRISVLLLVVVCFFSLINFSMRVSYEKTYAEKEVEILTKTSYR